MLVALVAAMLCLTVPRDSARAQIPILEIHYISVALQHCTQVTENGGGLPGLERDSGGVHTEGFGSDSWLLRCPLDFMRGVARRDTTYVFGFDGYGIVRPSVWRPWCDWESVSVQLMSANRDGSGRREEMDACEIETPLETHCHVDPPLGGGIVNDTGWFGRIYYLDVYGPRDSHGECFEWATAVIKHGWER